MSGTTRYPREQLLPLANALVLDLARFARRCAITGSLRRNAPDCGDIDLIVEPRTQQVIVRNIVARWGPLHKAGERYIQVIHRETGVPIDVFVVRPPAQWTVIMVARTGPAKLWITSQVQLRQRGIQIADGHLQQHNRAIPCPDEETYFKLAGLPCLPPEQRGEPAALVPLA